VVQAQLAGGKPLTAVLAVIAVAGKDVAAIEPHSLLGHAIVVQQANHARHLDFKIDALNPILIGRLKLGLEVADLAPRFEIVVSPLAVFDVDDFRQPAKQENERTPDIDHVDRHVLPI